MGGFATCLETFPLSTNSGFSNSDGKPKKVNTSPNINLKQDGSWAIYSSLPTFKSNRRHTKLKHVNGNWWLFPFCWTACDVFYFKAHALLIKNFQSACAEICLGRTHVPWLKCKLGQRAIYWAQPTYKLIRVACHCKIYSANDCWQRNNIKKWQMIVCKLFFRQRQLKKMQSTQKKHTMSSRFCTKTNHIGVLSKYARPT